MSKTTIPAGGITDGTLTSAKLDQDGAFTFNEDSGNVDFRVESNGDANCLIVDGSGDKVGIGEDVPEGKLHVFTGDASVGPNAKADEGVFESDGHAGISILSGASNDGNIYFGDSGDDDIGFITYAHGSDNLMQFGTNGAEQARITSGGEFCLGVTSATNSAHFTNLFSRVSHIGMVSENSGGEFSTEHIRFKNTGTTRGSIVVDQNNTTYNTTSDYRLKENVNYDWTATSRLKQLKPAQFNFISDENNNLIDGFLAHEVSSIAPQAVYGEKDAMEVETRYTELDAETQGNNPTKEVGEAKTYSTTEIKAQQLDHSKLVPLLVKTIQELEARVTTLEG